MFTWDLGLGFNWWWGASGDGLEGFGARLWTRFFTELLQGVTTVIWYIYFYIYTYTISICTDTFLLIRFCYVLDGSVDDNDNIICEF